MSILDAIKSNDTSIPLNFVTSLSRDNLIGRTQLYRHLADGNYDLAANSAIGVVILGILNKDDPYWRPEHYDAMTFGVTTPTANEMLSQLNRLSREELIRFASPIWVYIRSRIRTQYLDNGDLVDMSTGSAISDDNVRPVKYAPATDEVVAAVQTLRYGADIALKIDGGDDWLWPGSDDVSEYLGVTATSVLVLSKQAEWGMMHWLTSHNPSDPYGDGAPSPRSVAQEMINELERYGKGFSIALIANILLGIPCTAYGDRIVQEDSTMDGYTVFEVTK